MLDICNAESDVISEADGCGAACFAVPGAPIAEVPSGAFAGFLAGAGAPIAPLAYFAGTFAGLESPVLAPIGTVCPSALPVTADA